MDSPDILRIYSQTGKLPVSDRGREREAAILRVATRQFLERGYADTTLDGVAKDAGGSKSTLYKFFSSKTELFHAVVASLVASQDRQALDPRIDVYDCLLSYAEQRLTVVFAKQHWSLLRLVAAERRRFPRIAQIYYEVGPKRSKELIVDYLRTLTSRGVLAIKAPELAAQFFNSMLMHEWYLRHLYLAEKTPTTAQRRKQAEQAVLVFLAAHMPHHPRVLAQ